MADLSSALIFMQSIPTVTRAFIAATFACTGAYYTWSWRGVDVAYYLLLVPGSSIFTPWTFLTSAFVETSIFGFIITLIIVPFSVMYLERTWESTEMAKFSLVSIVGPNIMAFGLSWMEFFVTGDSRTFLYGMRYHGQVALQSALTVAFVQVNPNHEVHLLGMLKIRVKSLSIGYLVLSLLMCIFVSQCPWIIILFGWIVAWTYLRFIKKTAIGSMYTIGDRSDAFSLSSWFSFLRYPITIQSTSSRLDNDIEAGRYAVVPQGDRSVETEQRRAQALRAIDQRLSIAPSSNTRDVGPSSLIGNLSSPIGGGVSTDTKYSIDSKSKDGL